MTNVNKYIILLNADFKLAFGIYGDVKVSTGVLKSEERAAAGTALKILTLKLNANKNLAYAA